MITTRIVVQPHCTGFYLVNEKTRDETAIAVKPEHTYIVQHLCDAIRRIQSIHDIEFSMASTFDTKLQQNPALQASRMLAEIEAYKIRNYEDILNNISPTYTEQDFLALIEKYK